MRSSSAPSLAILLSLLAIAAQPAAAHPPSAIAVAHDSTVYFTDGARGVWRIGRDGNLTVLNDAAMHWMAIDHEGTFAEAPEEFGEWFGRLTPKGERPTLVSCSDFPCEIGPDGNLYFAKMHGLDIIRRTSEGQESVLVSRKDFNLAPDSHFGVNGIAVGRDGTAYVIALDSLNRRVGTGDHVLYAISSAGRIREIAKNFVMDKLPEGKQHAEVRPEYCRGMAVDDEKNVYVAVTGNRCVMKISADGASTVVLKCDAPWAPTGVAVLGDEVYVLEYDDETPTEGRNWPPRVRKVDREGHVTMLAEIKRDE
jgi:sugar lactone lactonase YvrE